MHSLWNTIFHQPVYNALIFLINHVTFGNVGFAIILLTILIKLAMFPLTRKSIISQIYMKKLEPEIKKLKVDYPNSEERAKKQMELYKKYGVNPFKGCLPLLLQFPIIIALYGVFRNFSLDAAQLYSFVAVPVFLNNSFLGFFNMTAPSIILDLLAGATQFIQGHLAAPKKKPGEVEVVDNGPKSFQDELGASMQNNMRYTLPVIVVGMAILYKFSAGVALYWITSNIFTIGQEWVVRNQIAKKDTILA